MSIDVREQAAAFLARQLKGQQHLEEQGNVDLFAAGLVNSLFALQLVQFVERQFGIRVNGDDLALENFRSLNAIEGFVTRKLTAVS